MRMKHALIPTLRDVPAEAQIPSHQLLLKAGYIQKVTAGMYTYLPLGKRVLAKVEQIIREEMDAADGQEILMPITQPAELWEESGRWDAYGAEMFRVVDRHGREFCLGPTHEEVVTDVCRQFIKSYKQVPLRLYQIQNKYRDERRPRFGLMRGREFVMKDLYSFDIDEAGLDQAYQDMYQAYNKIFSRCGLTFRPVLADSGQIGGGYTHEFMVLAENGEGTIAYCDSCDYAANIEIAEAKPEACEDKHDAAAVEKIVTPNIATIEDICKFLDDTPQNSIKSVLMRADDELIMVLVRGDREVNDVKVQHVHPCLNIEMADEDFIVEKIGAHPGSLGPVGLKDIPIYADLELENRTGLACGANEDGYHFIHVDMARDLPEVTYHDLRMLNEGEKCPVCSGTIQTARGIEVGQVFKLGTKYSEALGATVLNEEGKATVLQMGCYGIGVSRVLSATVEQHHDDKGIIWPKTLAPYHASLIVVNIKDEAQMAAGEKLYAELQQAGFDILFDDRKERAGVKFNDADLIGLPVRIVCGKKISDGIVEYKYRDSDEVLEVSVDEVVDKIKDFYQD
ncbi:MAG: proline--tRNA ligase [Peptococcaceae bacterium]|nr:proline--tRNA ligase [Peptococcaceae bacterium]